MIKPINPKEVQQAQGWSNFEMAAQIGSGLDLTRNMLMGRIGRITRANDFAEAAGLDVLGILRWWELQQDGEPTPAKRTEDTRALEAVYRAKPNTPTAERTFVELRGVTATSVLTLARKHGLSFTGLCGVFLERHAEHKELEARRRVDKFFDVSCDELQARVAKARKAGNIEKVDEIWRETRRRNWPRKRMIEVFE